jgi:hypothetical protein
MADFSQTLLQRLTQDKDPSHVTGLQAPFQQRLSSMLGGMPEPLRNRFNIYSGHRSVERQGQLWADALRKYGSPQAARKWVAPPGRSRHNHGTAADLRYADDDVKAWVHANAKNYGLHFPMRHEPWHIEPMGATAPASTHIAANAANEVATNGAPRNMAGPIGGAPIQGGPVPLTPPSQRYSKLADALLAQAAGAKPKNWGDLLNSAGDLALGYTLSNKEEEAQKDYQGKLAKTLMDAASGDTNTLATTLIGSGDPGLVQQGVGLKVAAAKAAQDGNKPIEINGRLVKFNPQTQKYEEVYAAPAKAQGPIEINGRIVQQQPDGSFKEVYAAPPKQEGLTAVAPGQTLFDPNNRQPVFTAPEKPQPLQSVAPGQTLYDPNKREPVFSTPERPKPPIEVNGRLVQDQGEKGYQEVYVAPPKPPKLEVADRKEIFEADEGAQASQNVMGSLDKALGLNDKAYSGFGAQTRGYIGSLTGAEGGEATEELHNVVTQQVLENLKATFGSAPTEGERQILLDVQGSVSKSPEVRRRIFENAKASAAKRLKFNQDRARALRSGDYYNPGYSPLTGEQTPPPAASEAAAPKQIQSQQEFNALPSGARFIDPEGKVRIKP